MRILGIDPGSVICGYGVIDKNGSKVELVEYGIIRAKLKDEDITIRLKEIFLRITGVIERSLPDECAIESMFFSKNVKSLVQLSQARASAMLAATLREVPVAEYSPLEVKKAVTGKGAAKKEQVGYMVKKILNISETPEFYDATDALAIALCHSYRNSYFDKNSTNWKDFLKKNPEKVINRNI